jgi:hypothetical protein
MTSAAPASPARPPAVPVPAVCDTCGTIFASSVMVSGGKASFTNCSAGPCPHCGGVGHIPDGIYEFVGNVLRILAAPERTVTELTQLRELLRRSQKKKESLEAAAARVERELPMFKRVGEELRRAPITTTSTVLTLILTAITTFLASRDSTKPHDVVVNQIINNYVTTLPAKHSGQAPHRAAKHPGRNERCPCGSGKKYKHCCGAPGRSDSEAAGL